MPLSQLFGFLGTGIVAAAYIPQIHHLIKEHCSAGISMTAYRLWCIASILFLIHAGMIRDTVFIVVQIINLAAILTIVICVKRYEQQMCLTHLHEAEARYKRRWPDTQPDPERRANRKLTDYRSKPAFPKGGDVAYTPGNRAKAKRFACKDLGRG